MSYRLRFLRSMFALPLLFQVLVGVQVSAESMPAIIITEVKVRNDTTSDGGLNEFIELYNPGTEPVSLNEYFMNFTSTSPPIFDSKKATVIATGLLPAGKSLVLAKDNLDLNLPNSLKSSFSNLNDAGGTLQITDLTGNVLDQFTWSSTLPVVAPVQHICILANDVCDISRTQSFGRSKDSDDNYEIANPLWVLGDPTPESTTLLPLPEPSPEPDTEPLPTVAEPIVLTDTTPSAETVDDNITPPNETTTETLAPRLPPQITELLPNPASPASDSTDEYIELYNPNDQPLDLMGYKLQTGNTFSYSHTFNDTKLVAYEYKAFLITETKVILSNSGGQARLLDPDGVVVAQTNVYDNANDGDAWALINGAWQWTTKSTPNAPNELTLPILKVASTKAPTVKKATVTKTSKPKATAKVASAKTTKSPKTSKTAATPSTQSNQDPEELPPTIHPTILAGVGAITLLYAVYEYRHDAHNALKRFQRNRATRRTIRSQSSGR